MKNKVSIGRTVIGGGESIKIQSMTTYAPSDTENCINQILMLQDAGCDIVRFCIRNEADARAIKYIKQATALPLVADIHFNFRLGILSIENGADKIRINPGNIGGEKNIEQLAASIRQSGAAVRVGSNTGSLEKKFLEAYGTSEQALVESALEKASLLEKYGVTNIVLSVKASDTALTVSAYRLAHKLSDYPLHIGVTEAGTGENAVIKSAVGIGALLLDGIGDTVRVSISGDPVPEVFAARSIIRAAGRDKNFVEVIACPTCGRCEWDCAPLAKKVEELTSNVKKHYKIAVMGCAVNGPGEAKDCDLGIAGGAGSCVIFAKGKPIRTLPKEQAETEFLKEIERLINGI